MDKQNEQEEFEEYVKFPEIGACVFMQSIYKNYFYDEIKNYSNLPSYDTCPVPMGKYEVKEYPMDAKMFEKHMEPGIYRVSAYLLKDSDVKSGVIFNIGIKKKE